MTAAADVGARLARTWLRRHRDARPDAGGVSRVGGFTLRTGQRETVAAIARALDEFGGALLADPPGTGKTVVALAVAAPSRVATVIAPATLRAQWSRAAHRAGVDIRFHSLESLSRSGSPERSTLVIVDEAHQARTPGTRRYARLAECCVGARVLLLTATPVVNRRADRDALLALFLGARAATADAGTIARCVLRTGRDALARPRIVRLTPLEGDGDVPGLTDALATLPPPMPAADGSEAGALVRISLAMAWSSSLAALDAALRRRQQRGHALRDALTAGRWPTRAALRRWVHGEDATQLAFPALEPAGAWPGGTVDGDPPLAHLVAQLDAHLRAVDAMRGLLHDRIASDTSARAGAVLALARQHRTCRIAVFARHTDTVRALWRALAQEPGVIAITGARVVAAHGRWSRAEVLEALGPRSGALRDGDPRAIRILLTTDLLAEGVELQGIALMVHADGAWTPARLEQREGRIARLGARAPEVLVTRFRAPAGATPLLRLGARLERKRRARRHALAPASDTERIDLRLTGWLAAPGGDGGRRRSALRIAVGRVPASSATHGSFLALLRRAPELVLVAGRRTAADAPWRVSGSARAVLRALDETAPVLRGTDPSDDAGPLHAAQVARVVSDARRALTRHERQGCARQLLGPPPARTTLLARARARADRMLRRQPLGERPARADAIDAALARLARAPGAGVERRLGRLLRTADSDATLVTGMLALAEELVRATARTASDPRSPAPHDAKGDGPRSRLVALVIAVPEAVPDDVARRAPSPPPAAPGPSRPSASP